MFTAGAGQTMDAAVGLKASSFPMHCSVEASVTALQADVHVS